MYTHNEVSSSDSTKCTNSDSVVTTLIPSHWIKHNLRVVRHIGVDTGVRVDGYSIMVPLV